jgi:hypothetical protein
MHAYSRKLVTGRSVKEKLSLIPAPRDNRWEKDLKI